ncbi:tetratricopeptide repeat protein, partial [Kitasatospora sp. NPDC056181]|uniref:tetratricopeptide repeat protein n=1 Tax=Kitasatospora sp. NPDC056181 TaxID=3345737 RepID=UPI0035DE16C6
MLIRPEDAAADTTANLGHRILQAVWRRRTGLEQAELEAAVQDAAKKTRDEHAAAALRQQIKRALRDDTDLRNELASLLPAPAHGTVTITASGARSIAASTIGAAITGDIYANTITGNSYQEADDPTHAVRLLVRALAQQEEALGDTHPSTLATRNNLANAYQAAGDLARAIPLFETTLAQQEEALGDTHPSTLATRNNLAAAYQEAGDLARAIPLFETTLAQREQVLGDTHPSTLATRNNLAAAYQAADDLARAIPLFETTLAQQEEVLGDT